MVFVFSFPLKITYVLFFFFGEPGEWNFFIFGYLARFPFFFFFSHTGFLKFWNCFVLDPRKKTKGPWFDFWYPCAWSCKLSANEHAIPSFNFFRSTEFWNFEIFFALDPLERQKDDRFIYCVLCIEFEYSRLINTLSPNFFFWEPGIWNFLFFFLGQTH